RIARAHGISNGRETTAVFTTQNLLTGANTGPQNSRPDKNHFTSRFRTTTNNALVIDPKRRELFHGLKRDTKGQLSPLAKIDGLLSAKAIGQLMHNGKMQDHSERTIGNTCLAMNARSPI